MYKCRPIYVFLLLNFSVGKSKNSPSNTQTDQLYDILTNSLAQNYEPSVSSLQTEILGNPEILTENGTIIGVTYPESHAFYSIRYGQPPTGKLRFKPPEKAIQNQTLNASTPNFFRCFEVRKAVDLENLKDYYTEDCLLLNIAVPSSVNLSALTTEKLPVMFWLHGGAFFAGSGTARTYDARFLSNVTNTIVVTVNYRLDAFGFLVYDDEDEVLEGNQGMKDQQLALEWVHDNIAYFGGDKNMVTIFGHSCGAQSINLHLMSEKSKPFFKRAIMLSNPAAFYYPEKSEAKMKAKVLLENLECGSKTPIECLRTLPPEDIIAAHRKVAFSDPLNIFNVVEPFRPVIDDEFTEQPLTYFRSGKWQHEKEVIIGTTTQEVAKLHNSITNMNFKLFQILTNLLVGIPFAPEVIEKYRELIDDDNNLPYDYTDLFVQEASDLMFVCPSRLLARFMSNTSTADGNHPAVYFYIDNHPLDGPTCENISETCGYAFHGSEIIFVFNNGPLNGYVYSENDTIIVSLFNMFWGNFAYTGKPTSDLSIWPHYTQQELSTPSTGRWSNIRIQAPVSFVESEYSKDICDFWDNLGLYIDPNTTEDETTSRTIAETTPASTMEMTIGSTIGTTTGASVTHRPNSAALLLSFLMFSCLKLIELN